MSKHHPRKPRPAMSRARRALTTITILIAGSLGFLAAAGTASANTTPAVVTPIQVGNAVLYWNTYDPATNTYGSAANGAKLIDDYEQLNGLSPALNEEWQFIQVGNQYGTPYYEIVNDVSLDCITTDGTAGDTLYMEPCTGSNGQLWLTNLVANPQGSNYGLIQSWAYGLYVDVYGDSTAAHTNIDSWSNNDQTCTPNISLSENQCFYESSF